MGRQARLKRQRRLETEAVVPPRVQAREVDLLGTIGLLEEHLTESLCQEVFDVSRSTERQRKFSLYTLAEFWTAVIIRNPQSVTQAFEEAVGSKAEEKLWPRISGSRQAFFERCQTLPPIFFENLFHRFAEAITPEAEVSFCSEFAFLRKHYSEILAIDGSMLNAIAHRLKILWDVRSVILPGCVSALYDLYRGYARHIRFSADAAKAEMKRCRELLAYVPRGSLLLGDRLYASVALFVELEKLGVFGLFRATKTLTVKKISRISRRKLDGGVLEDWFVDVGSGETATPQTLRFIKYRKGSIRFELFTNELDPQRLSAETALSLYRERWKIERMWFDLKEVLNLNQFHAANPNAVAMQVFAAALVYTALRVSQSKIAKKVRIQPEEISTAKLFPKMAEACAKHAGYLMGIEVTFEFNEGVALKRPGPKDGPRFTVRLGSILRQRRNGKRRKRRYCKARGRWKSLAHVKGGSELT